MSVDIEGIVTEALFGAKNVEHEPDNYLLHRDTFVAAVQKAVAAAYEDAAKIADRCADDETRKALGANAMINASQIASAIRSRSKERQTS